jgi:hypothetical protein
VKSPDLKRLASRLGRLIVRFAKDSSVHISFLMAFVVSPILLGSTPQHAEDSSAGPTVASVAENQRSRVTDFPQLPYQ